LSIGPVGISISISIMDTLRMTYVKCELNTQGGLKKPAMELCQ